MGIPSFYCQWSDARLTYCLCREDLLLCRTGKVPLKTGFVMANLFQISTSFVGYTRYLFLLLNKEFISTSVVWACCSMEVGGRRNILNSKPYGQMSGLPLWSMGEIDLWGSSDLDMDKSPPPPSTGFVFLKWFNLIVALSNDLEKIVGMEWYWQID